MCLPDFKEFKQIEKTNPLIGYRSWKLSIHNPAILKSEHQKYDWNNIIEGPHVVTDSNSGIYAYNYNYSNNYNYNNYYYSNNYNNNYNYSNKNYNNYYMSGIINQYGRVAIHRTGQRSEYAKINKIFTIRESDAKGPKEFLDWISKFNFIIVELAKKYECETINWQDFAQ